MMYRIILQLKVLLGMPIYRVDILRAAKSSAHHYSGLCTAIKDPLSKAELEPNPFILFPLFGARIGDFNGDIRRGYWWDIGDWESGRMDYLNWLIKEYKNDKTDLSKSIWKRA